MHINSYAFGRMVIDGKVYTADLIIYPDKIEDHWWRKEGHYLQKEDIGGVIAANPDLFIVGTGDMGVMQIPDSTISFLHKKGIEVLVARTGKAVELYNLHSGHRKVIAAFHLTC
jgi:hypothetical protein